METTLAKVNPKTLLGFMLVVCLAALPMLAMAEPPTVDVAEAVTTLTDGVAAVAAIGAIMLVLAATGAVFGWVLARII